MRSPAKIPPRVAEPFVPRDTSLPPGVADQAVGLESPRQAAVERRTADRSRSPWPQPVEAWNQASVAELSSRQISAMSDLELVGVIRAGRLPAVEIRPEWRDRATLERLAHLARLCCRNRSHSTPQGPR